VASRQLFQSLKGATLGSNLNSPLSGRVDSGFGGSGKFKRKIIFGTAIVASVPLVLSTFAASVTVGTGSLEFGQGSQQATACDKQIYVALGEEWKAAPTPEDSSAGFFRVRTVTVSNLDLQSCAGKKLRVRLIDQNSAEITIGSIAEAKVLQVTIPSTVPTSNLTDGTALGLSYLTGIGNLISGTLLANASVSVSGTSIYDGSVLSAQNGDVTFYVDPSAATVNIDGQSVRRTTVETIDNPGATPVVSPTPSPSASA
jgi:hypothetical protein